MTCCGEKKGRNFKIITIMAFVLGIGGIYYLWTRHNAHLIQYLPFVLLLLCPLSHLFGGHGGHRERGSKENDR